jgi:hypothetical protein
MRLVPTALILILCLVLAACGKEADAPASTSDTAEAATDDAIAAAGDVDGTAAEPDLPPLPAGDFRVASVRLGSEIDAEGQVPAPKDVFKPGDRIHAAVIGIGSSDGLTLSARWSTAEGTEIATAGQSLAPTAPTVTTFAIAQPGPWPAGESQVDIAINGRVVETGRFRVE